MKWLLAKFHVVTTAGLSVLICFLVYLLVRNSDVRINFSSADTTSLNEVSQKTLSLFGSDKIEVNSFFSNAQIEKEKIEDLLRKYSEANPNFQFQVMDPDESPQKAKEMKIDSYGVTIIRARGREMRIESTEEEDLTAALSKIISDFKRTIYVISGHEEPKLDDMEEEGYRALFNILAGRGYTVKAVQLKFAIPKDADLVVLAGPHTDLTEAEIKILDSYLSGGGKMFFALDPVYQGEGNRMKDFLLKWGFELGNDVVIDKLSKEMGVDYLVAMSTEYAGELFQGFELPALFPVVRSVRIKGEVPNFQLEEAVRTSLGSWAEMDLAALEDGNVSYDEGVDFPGPLPIAALSFSNDKKRKIFVVGDSDFLNNAHLHMASNFRLTARIFSWLLDDVQDQKVSLPAAEKLFLLPHEKKASIFYFSIGIVPALFLLATIFILISRKRFA